MDIDGPEEFLGTERFAIERRLGAGGFGVVYRAHDRKRDSVVALKTLRRADSDALYRFKKEFRSLADIVHPNLVTLYELLSERDLWFFTMELIEGVNFLDHVRGTRSVDGDSRPSDSPTRERPPTPAGIESTAARQLLRIGLTPANEPGEAAGVLGLARLRPALLQLAEGLHVLHAAGKLHRDIKPSNILVMHDGRVVLLDFGLVSDMSPEGFHHSIHLAGTPAYMSPEQAAGSPVTAASDWYGVGVMLYEALTGTRPFPGEFLDVLVEKQRSEAVPPRDLVCDVPEDLSSLCSALLRRDPRDRPAEEEILRSLRSVPAQRSDTPAPAAARAAPFVGREQDLAALMEAYERTKDGCAVAVLVRGSSGVGKTALIRRFLEDVKRRDAGTVILTGRCYEQETVPYKALDSLVDALSHYLKKLPQAEVEGLLPRDLLALARLFPVLRQVEAVAMARRRVVAVPDSLELRRRGFGALRELLARLSDRAPLVLFIDDLHWGDADSAALLIELLRPPEPPPMLLMGCYRTEDAGESPLLKAVFDFRPGPSPDLDVRELMVSELPPEDARELARLLLEDEGATREDFAASIARESRGNPFLIDELTRHVRTGANLEPSAATGPVRLEDVIRARIARLPADALRLLEVVAVAGRPVSRAIAGQAAGLTEDDQPALALLRTGHLVRGTTTGSDERVEIYHDRIGQTVVSLIAPSATEAIHQRLALALEISRDADPESLALHYQRAGAKERAAVYAADAAALAAEALAFDRAARLYRQALDLGTADPAERQRLRFKLANALANAGRGADAAHEYLATAEGANASEALELQRLAADQLLRSGHVDEGLSVLRRVLDRIGMKLPATPRGALLSFLLRRVQLRLRGFSFRERSSAEIPAEDLIRIDACWSVSTGLSLIDTIRGRTFQTRHMLLALRAGEPYRVARAMANEAGYTAYLGGWAARRRTQELVDGALALSQRVGQPHALGMAYLNASLVAYLEGRWGGSYELFQRCEEILRNQCTGVVWELDLVHVTSLRALVFMGRLRELAELLPKYVVEARERGDLFAEVSLRTRHSYVRRLMSDEPEKARAGLRRAVDQWSQQSFYMQHYFRLMGEAEISLYSGSGRLAWRDLLDSWPGLEQSLLRRAQFFRIESQHLRARCALAAASKCSGDPTQHKALLRSARQDARRLRREATPWADSFASLLEAGIASLEGRREESLTALAAAQDALEAGTMALYAAAARRCRGILLGGEEGRGLVEAADAWMRGEGIRNPDRMTAMLAPGRWTAP